MAHSRAPGYRACSALSVPAIAVGWCAKSSMMVIPFTCARTSRRRFTLLKVFKAAAICSFEIPHPDAKAEAAVAFSTLYSPARANSKSDHGSPLRSTDHEVRAGSRRRLVTLHVADGLLP